MISRSGITSWKIAAAPGVTLASQQPSPNSSRSPGRSNRANVAKAFAVSPHACDAPTQMMRSAGRDQSPARDSTNVTCSLQSTLANEGASAFQMLAIRIHPGAGARAARVARDRANQQFSPAAAQVDHG
jgi:hypothetical protein